VKPALLKIYGATDKGKTACLKAELTRIGHCPVGYEWHQGEPLYHGNPTSGAFQMLNITVVEYNRCPGCGCQEVLDEQTLLCSDCWRPDVILNFNSPEPTHYPL
jgi:hypothetical protein